MIRLLRHLGHEGPRHDGRYGFGGRRTRYAYVVADFGIDTAPALVIDPDTWARITERLTADIEKAFPVTAAPPMSPYLFGTPVKVTDLLRRWGGA